jgi:hypothetical protein
VELSTFLLKSAHELTSLARHLVRHNLSGEGGNRFGDGGPRQLGIAGGIHFTTKDTKFTKGRKKTLFLRGLRALRG